MSDFDLILDPDAENYFLLSARAMLIAWKTPPESELFKTNEQLSFELRALTREEFDRAERFFTERISTQIARAGTHRIDAWETGWYENLEAFRVDGYSGLVPKYFGKYPVIRWQSTWYAVSDRNTEYLMFKLLVDWVLDRFIDKPKEIYEFGCGTGHNLLNIRNSFPGVKIVGLDWATSSQSVIDALAGMLNDQNMCALNYDYFEPNTELCFGDDAYVLTFASLEQTGSNYAKFVEHLLELKPKLVIHVEPIGEFLSDSVPLEKLSLDYFERRNYLKGYFDYIKSLQAENLVDVVYAARSFLGSFFIEGYSVLVWRPV